MKRDRKPSYSTIRRMVRYYRHIIDNDPDPLVGRIAQGMETALRWATEVTHGWRMKEEPDCLADCARRIDGIAETKPRQK